MATVKFSALISDIRGKVGGAVFARGANGSYIRTFAKPINTNTALQQVKKQNLSCYAQKWRGLTDLERQSWIDNAALHLYQNRVGDTSKYTGFQWYMKTNMLLESAALEQ